MHKSFPLWKTNMTLSSSPCRMAASTVSKNIDYVSPFYETFNNLAVQ